VLLCKQEGQWAAKLAKLGNTLCCFGARRRQTYMIDAPSAPPAKREKPDSQTGASPAGQRSSGGGSSSCAGVAGHGVTDSSRGAKAGGEGGSRTSDDVSRPSAFGHAGPFTEEGFFYKPVSTSSERVANETRMLDMCMRAREHGEPMSIFVPEYFGIVQRGDRRYIKLRDLLGDFRSPWLMDIKMGVRCYAEKELKNQKPRNDLFERMVKMEGRMGREVLTDAERSAQAITKARWMTLRDSLSSTQSLGFRVDGIVTASFHKTAFESELFMAREDGDVLMALRSFIPSAAECQGCTPRDMARSLLRQLTGLREALEASEVFPKNEFIGSSLFFAADTNGKVGVWMIDFNITTEISSGLKHDIAWELGNHEDGYLIGLRNLERLWAEMLGDDYRWQ